MIQKRKITSIFAIAALAAIVGVVSFAEIPESSAEKGKTYKVTVTNLTPGQPLTPPLLATHTKNTGIFSIGEESSEELQQLAENGDLTPLVTALSEDKNVVDVVHGIAPLVPANDPGETGLNSSETFTIMTHGKAKYISFASMLVCSNDGFTGLDSIRLPLHKKTILATSYDARSEMNTEDFADIVPPCQAAIGVSSDDLGTGESNPELSEDGIVIPHPGIIGGDDLLPGVHGWSDPVAKITIERMNNGNDKDKDD